MPRSLAPYSKFIMAILGVGLTYASTKYAGAPWLGPVVAAFASVGVYATPNSPAAPNAAQIAAVGKAVGRGLDGGSKPVTSMTDDELIGELKTAMQSPPVVEPPPAAHP